MYEGQVKHENEMVLLENGGSPCMGTVVFRGRKLVGKNDLTLPKRMIKLVDKPACIVMFHKTWTGSAYAPLSTKVLHKWNIKSVLRRAGVRND